MPHPNAGRFLTIPQVAEELATSEAQISALVKRGDQARSPRSSPHRAVETGECLQRSYEETGRAPWGRQDDVSADKDYRRASGARLMGEVKQTWV